LHKESSTVLSKSNDLFDPEFWEIILQFDISLILLKTIEIILDAANEI